MLPIGDYNRRHGVVPFVTYLLIVVNVLVFLYEIGQPDPEAFFRDWAVVPAQITAGQQLYTLVTAMFLHGGWLHLFGNMLALWIFGDNVEDAFGHGAYLLFYLLAGLAGSVGQVLVAPESNVPGLGASGAIAGIMAAYLVMFGTNRVRVLVGFIVMGFPAFIVIGFWAIMQILGTLQSFGQADIGGVGYAAHVAGFVVGLVLTFFLRPATRPYVRRS